MGMRDNDLDNFIEDLLKNDFTKQEAEVLRKIVTSRKEKQLWKKTIEWARQSKFFENLDQIRVMMQLENKKGKIHYSTNSIPWWIHQYWEAPDVYLNERLQTIRTSQTVMLNIYSSFVTIIAFSLFVFALNLTKDLFLGGHAFWGIIILIITIILTIFGLLLKKYFNELIRNIFVTGSLNNLEIERYIIANILSERKENNC